MQSVNGPKSVTTGGMNVLVTRCDFCSRKMDSTLNVKAITIDLSLGTEIFQEVYGRSRIRQRAHIDQGVLATIEILADLKDGEQ